MNAAQNVITPNYFEGLSIADSLARKFVEAFPSREPIASFRAYLRGFCIPGMRWLWRNGSVEVRTTIAARVAVWRGKTGEATRAVQIRVGARELSRLNGGAK